MVKDKRKCPKCTGCGKVADSADEEPWSAWLSLPLAASVAVLAGIVMPKICPLCGGSGKVELSE